MSGAWVGENKLTGEYQVLTSWRNAQDPEPGIFIETVDPNGSSEFLFMWNRSRTYWQTGLWTGRFFANMPESARGNVLFNQTYVETPAYRRLTNILYNNETITRLVLDLSGQSWQLFWTAPTVQCDVYALCGVFGVCDQRSELPCRCPPSFTPAPEGGWTLTDRSVAAARARHSPLRKVKLLDDPLAVGVAQSKAECESACLKSCSCQAYAFSNGDCAVWPGDLRNVQQLYADSGVSGIVNTGLEDSWCPEEATGQHGQRELFDGVQLRRPPCRHEELFGATRRRRLRLGVPRCPEAASPSCSEEAGSPSWRERYSIMVGMARGLAYLHHGCRECIVHCDIKPKNILLDEDMSARIADFGMAKLVGRNFSRALTTMRGTIGYLAPEWISGQPISAKVDVYSFGMVLFELISGRRNSEGYSEVEATGTMERGRRPSSQCGPRGRSWKEK
uniref:non-specific serine/threonine protein kinase n=1 Tax=Aegilops tauschii TaxID=37682 RepID=M8BRA9_AEGTA